MAAAHPSLRSTDTASGALLEATKGSVERALEPYLAKLIAKNFLVFCRLELGLETPPHVRDWATLLEDGEDCLVISPRDHGKSIVLARAYPIWKLKYDPLVREVYILGADQSSAVENLDKLKTMMEETPSLRQLIPSNRSEGFNSRTEVRLRNGKTIFAKAFLSTLRGRHPQMIILDDVLNETNSLGEEMRAKVKHTYYSVIMPMKDRGTQKKRAQGYRPQIVTVGTPQHPEDLYHHMREVNPDFTIWLDALRS